MIRNVPATLTLFATTFILYYTFRVVPTPHLTPRLEWDEGLFKVLLWVVPTIVGLRLLRRQSFQQTFEAMGLTRRALQGYGFGFMATLPMLVLLALGGPLRLDSGDVVASVLLGPIAEEILFRGFLVFQLWQWAGWNAAMAILAGAAVFGLAHFGNTDIGPAQIWIIATAGVLFGWIAVRWRSLWPAVGLHAFTNFWWDATRVRIGAASIDSGLANLGRLASIGLAIALTVVITRKRGQVLN